MLGTRKHRNVKTFFKAVNVHNGIGENGAAYLLLFLFGGGGGGEEGWQTAGNAPSQV